MSDSGAAHVAASVTGMSMLVERTTIHQIGATVAGNLVLKSINDLFGEKFVIPAYQRGYRWTKRQVTDLLDDLRSFKQKNGEKTFYCLQPVVVKKSVEYPGHWEVIDGQQRLTTIYIIIKYLADSNNIQTEDAYLRWFKKVLYSIEYETRPRSKEFLASVTPDSEDDSNPDFFYMGDAIRTVRDWCEKLDMREQQEFLGKITGRDNVENEEYAMCKVIWYEVDDQSDGPEMFGRLNVGKIPLTNAELVKALFLSRAEQDGKLRQESHKGEIALIWDEMEQQLQDKDFWAFITNEDEKPYTNRIELLFDLHSGKYASKDEFHTFLHFLNILNVEKKLLWDLWLEIEGYYQTLREWYRDRNLYHQIGYLVNVAGEKGGRRELKNLLEESQSIEKNNFHKKIAEKISNTLKEPGQGSRPLSIEDLTYEDKSDYTLISKILLLFNVESIRRNRHSEERYPFQSSKSGGWTLEHIHAQASKPLDETKRDVWIAWTEEHRKTLDELIEYLEAKPTRDTESDKMLQEAKELREKAQRFLDKPDWTHLKFNEELFMEIVNLFTAPAREAKVEDEIHGIANLALLKADDNSAFNNSVFEAKRRKMLELDKNGSYIPICTRRVFLKYYSKNVSETQVYFWGTEDRKSYMDEIKDVLKDYLPAQSSEENES